MEYVQKVMPIMNRYGGKLIALDRNVTRLEGQPEQLLTIVEYPNMESAKAFYSSKEYTDIKNIRTGATTGGFLVISEGAPAK